MGKISVILPTFKRKPFMVKRAIDSVLTQTYTDFELIIVDDSPNSYAGRYDVEVMVKSINDDRIKYIKHPKNMGGCEARNTGIKSARGKFIAFIDDDDEWLPKKLEIQMSKFINPNIGLVYCNYKILDSVKGIATNRIVNHEGNVFEKLMMSHFIGSYTFVLVRKECFENCGMLDTSMQSAQDHEMWLRICKKYEVACAEEILAVYNIHHGDRITKNYGNKIQGYERILEKYSDYFECNKSAKVSNLRRIYPYYVKMRKKKKAIQVYVYSLISEPLKFRQNTVMTLYLLMLFLPSNNI